MALTVDELWPRVPEYRYRIYAVRGAGRRDQELEVLAACPDAAGVGLALVTLHEDQKALTPPRRLADLGRIGVLDVLAGGPNGEWIVLPWDRHHT